MDITNGLTLSQAVKDKSTPLRQYLQRAFPSGRLLQNEFKKNAGDLVVDTAGAQAGTVGTSVDLLIRFLLDPDDVPQSARILFPFNISYTETVDELAGTAGDTSRAGDIDEESFARAVWALALCVEAHRSGGAYGSVVVDLVRGNRFGTDVMLAQATPAALTELIALRRVASERLIPNLHRPFHLGPEFDMSKRDGIADTRLIAAEADLICDGLLIDIKTQLGTKNSEGRRGDRVTLEQLYQLLAYALLDHSNTYGITELGFYSARYGSLTMWPLEYFTAAMAGHPVDFTTAREQLWDMMHQ